MSRTLGLVIELGAGIWLDADMAGLRIQITRLEHKFEICMPEAAGYNMSRPRSTFPDEYMWGLTAASSAHDWGFLSNHDRVGDAIRNATYNVKRFIVTLEVVGADTDFEALRKAFIEAWNETWTGIRVALEIATSQDFQNGSNLDSGASENYLHVSDQDTARSHLFVDLGTRPIIQAKPLNRELFERVLELKETQSEVWTAKKLLRDARIRFNAREYSTAFLHIATALEIYLKYELDKIEEAQKDIEQGQESSRNITLGTWVQLWNKHVEPGFQSKIDTHVGKRNRIIHDGAEVGDRETFDFYSIAGELVEKGYLAPLT